MKIWIDQDCCTGAGLCVDHCPELFIVSRTALDMSTMDVKWSPSPSTPSVAVPRLRTAAIDAVERCPGECIYLESDEAVDHSGSHLDEAADIVDAEVIDG